MHYLVTKDSAVTTNTQTRRLNHCPTPLLLSLTICCCTGACFLMFLFLFFFPFPVFVVIMTSRCFNFRFAYPLPLLPHLHTARMASGHPTDKFSFMYQPDTHKRYGARMHTHSHKSHNSYSQWAGKSKQHLRSFRPHCEAGGQRDALWQM